MISPIKSPIAPAITSRVGIFASCPSTQMERLRSRPVKNGANG